MAAFDTELVGKIGSMALINQRDHDIDYNIFARIGRELRPGWIWVSSGATEIGRLDYIRRNGCELQGDKEENKSDYSAQGQAILMMNYRQFIDPRFSVRQLLVEHQHFNDEKKSGRVRDFLLRCAAQNAIPIVNYNDTVSFEENRKWEIAALQKSRRHVVECVDNDETAAQIACLVKSRVLLILTSVDGIYRDHTDPSTLQREISGKDADEVIANIEEFKKSCVGASRTGANGARAKLEFIKEPVMLGTKVMIANAKYGIREVLEGRVPCTVVGVR